MLKACYASPLVSLLARASTVARLAVLVYRLLPLFAAILVANAGAQNLARGVVASYSFEGDFRDAALGNNGVGVGGVLFEDGVPRFISAHTVQGHPIWIGAHYGLSARQIDGRVDEVRIYNRALTTAEVQLLFYQTYQARFISLGFVSDAPAIPTSISADGRFIVGRIQPGASADVAEWGDPWHGFLWTRETGAQDIYPQTGLAWAMGVSADGSVVVGVDRGWNSYRWVRTLNTLVLIAGGFSGTHDLSDDGQVVVGLVYGYTPYVSGYRWTPHSGLQTLGTLPGDRFSDAFGVSADGSVIVGTTLRDWAPYWHQNRAYLWDQRENRMKELTGPLGGWPSFHAMGVSADGSTVVGIAHSDANANIWALPYAAFRWTTSSRRMESLGSLGGQRTYVWHAVSADGSVIYGGSENTLRQWRAFRWTVGRGMEDINEVFRYTIPPRWVLHNVVDCTPDGRFIVGWGTNPSGKIEGFLLDTYTGASPSPPTNLRAFALSSTQIQLDWKDNSMGEQGFEIERKGESGDYTVIAQVGANVTTYTDGGLTRDTTYTYRVRAYNAAGKSPYSNPASATTCSGNGLLHEERCFYRANLHSHSSYSDGRWTIGRDFYPWDVFALVRKAWDVWAITDHGEQLTEREWSTTEIDAYEVMNRDPTFVALRGFEWTGYTDDKWNPFDIPTDIGGGHINVFGSSQRKGAYEASDKKRYPIQPVDVLPGLPRLYDWLASTPAFDGKSLIAQFNHPTTYDEASRFAFAGQSFRLPSDTLGQSGIRNRLLEVFALMEVGSHTAPWESLLYEGGTENLLTGNLLMDQRRSNEFWFRVALFQGWHVAPTNNRDNHVYFWIDNPSHRMFTGIWAPSFGDGGYLPEQRTSMILDALRSRRVFASEDWNTQLTFQARIKRGNTVQQGWYWMGSTFEMPADADALEIKVWVAKSDVTYRDYIERIELFISPSWIGSEQDNLPQWYSFVEPSKSTVDETFILHKNFLRRQKRNALGEVYMYLRVTVARIPLVGKEVRLLYSAPIWIQGVPADMSSPPDKEPL